MLAFGARRFLQSLPTVLAAALIVFVLFSVIPGSFATSMFDDGRGMDAELMERIRKELGLDDPLHLRFANYIRHLAVLDLGTSFRTREPVVLLIANRIWPTFQLVVAAMALAITLGVSLGFLAAMRPGGIIDAISMFGAVSGLSIAQFWFGLLLMYLLALKLGWFPTFGYGNLHHLVLPAVTLSVAPLALLARTTRAAVLEVVNADFVRTARSKGMSEARVVRWHVLRNVAVIVLTTLGLQFGTLMGQAVVVERLFSWPGLGSLLVESVFQRDIPTVQGCILVIVLFFLVVNTLVDIACAMIDPRIKYG